MDELFRLEDVTVLFGRHEVLKKFNLSIYDRERIAICGPSGTGKSTLLRCLNLLQHIEHGTIYFRGQKIIEANNGVAKVLVDEEPDEARRLAARAVSYSWPDRAWVLNAAGWVALAHGERERASQLAVDAAAAAVGTGLSSVPLASLLPGECRATRRPASRKAHPLRRALARY